MFGSTMANDALRAFEAAKQARSNMGHKPDDLGHEGDEEWDDTQQSTFDDDREDIRNLSGSLWDVLKVKCEGEDRIVGGESRLYAAFHSCSTSYYSAGKDTQTSSKLRHAAFAFTVLRDRERRRIYNTLGFDGLEKSEAYVENSVFDIDPAQVVDDFYSGIDPHARDYLLLNSTEKAEEGDWSEDEYTDDEDMEELLGKKTTSSSNDDGDKQLPTPPPGLRLDVNMLEDAPIREAEGIYASLNQKDCSDVRSTSSGWRVATL